MRVHIFQSLKFCGWEALDDVGNDTKVPANAFTININFTNGNTSITADFLKKAKPYKEFLLCL